MSSPAPFVNDLPTDWLRWLVEANLIPGTPFLLSPAFEYDVDLNSYFQQPVMAGAATATQVGYARDIAAFLSFLWSARDVRSWRSVREDDHLAYLAWRRRDPAGPMVAGATWDREVAGVNSFYRWAIRAGHVLESPVPQMSRRPSAGPRGPHGRRSLDEVRPATYSHDSAKETVQWLPPAQYRTWRDVGIRGFTVQGLPDQRFRGRWAARNGAFCDLMVRTGLRLQEQASMTVFDLPRDRLPSGYHRFWLAQPVAKGSSARWVYVPASVASDLSAYMTWDRATVIAAAQAERRYERWRRPWIVDDPVNPVARQVGGTSRVKIGLLDAMQRSLLLIDGQSGLEPASLWLSESGLPLSMSTWKAMFADANRRCISAGLAVRCHAHMLRHTFAVVTLEQLQRGHIAALAELLPQQREHYTRIFGDPLDWVRRRLGHRSVVTTQVYLHALAELEMQTRMTLVPDGWDAPPQMQHVIDEQGESGGPGW